MTRLTTHVLDTMNGCPAAGMRVTLHRLHDGGSTLVREAVLNADGRTDTPLLDGADGTSGRYRLTFAVADYFRARGVALPDPPFLDAVPVAFGLADGAHYHVPLLTSPWAYSTYRGS